MSKIVLKRVYEPAEDSDGFRVLVDRLWPRGIKKENLSYDLWIKDIAPSAQLREWYHQDEESRWKDFGKAYRKELKQSPALEDFLDKLKGHDKITLLYAAKDEKHNNAIVVRDFLKTELK